MSGTVIAIEGPSAAGKTTVAARVARTTGGVVLPEAYRRIIPTPNLELGSPAELLDLEERLLREDADRYLEALARARAGATVVADTGFLGPLTYTWALVVQGAAPLSSLVALRDRARSLARHGEWGLADEYFYLETTAAARAGRIRADRAGHPPALARRHEEVGVLELRFYRERFAPLLGSRFHRVPAGETAPVVADRVVALLRAPIPAPGPRPRIDAVLARFEVREGPALPSRGNR
ncbi:MAG: AAA family ATPase [Thermoplasmata archaeon]